MSNESISSKSSLSSQSSHYMYANNNKYRVLYKGNSQNSQIEKKKEMMERSGYSPHLICKCLDLWWQTVQTLHNKTRQDSQHYRHENYFERKFEF